VGLELVERAEPVVDRRSELAGRLVAAVGRQVGPEDRVVDVAAEVEREVLLESRASASCARAVLAPVTYAWWCFEWCSSMIRPLIDGSRAA